LSESPNTLPAQYQERLTRYTAERDRRQWSWNLVANLRLVAFVVLAVMVWQLLRTGVAGWWLGVALALVAVVALVTYHRQLRRERDRLTTLIRINEAAEARLTQRWDELTLPPPVEIPPGHPYANDLNVTGRASLAQRIGTPVTDPGWATLFRWLLGPAPIPEVRSRQEAVAELAPLTDLRQDVERAGAHEGEQALNPRPLLDWAEGETWFGRHPVYRALRVVSPLALWMLVALNLLGLTPLPLWLIPLVVNIVISQALTLDASARLAMIAPLHLAIAGYQAMIDAIISQEYQSDRLRATHGLMSGPDGAARQVRSLRRRSAFAIPTDSIMGFGLNALFLWDLNVLAPLETWQTAHGQQIRGWLAALGEFEALAALSVLAADHDDWSFPTIAHDARGLTAHSVGHPLIRADEVVRNDVAVGPAGSFLFVTGSNMSGKSTLLRAIGANLVLAGAGGPVCARELTAPPVELWTCMRIEDSLERGVSFFMAELQRLKQVVDAARTQDLERPVFYLLDEILQGTNTAERQIASRRVITTLVRSGALGAVSSHDLDLVDAEPLREMAQPVHFAEQFNADGGAPRMSFDYLLKPGVATSTNALALMTMIGLAGDE
jgi:energy-coupling factor transporter ATP-binding protein EcfA2